MRYIINNSQAENIVQVESVCCFEKNNLNHNYLEYFYKLNTKLKEIVDESLNIWKYNKYFLNKGSLSVCFPGKANFTSLLHIDDIVDEEIYNLYYLYYNFSDEFPGVKRIYIGDVNNKYDKVSGEYFSNIKKKKLNKEEYLALIEEIKKNNIHYNNYEHFTLEHKYDDLKNVDYINKISILCDRLGKILNKSAEEVSSLKNKLKDLGLYRKNKEYLSSEEEIKDKESVFSNRIQNIKLIINEYFRKYVEMISNKYEVKDIPKFTFEDEEDKKQFITDFIHERKYFEEFYKYSKIFSNLNFEYSLDDINHMNGEKNIYDIDWLTITKGAKHSYKDVSEILMYILIYQLNDWLSEKTSIKHHEQSFSSSTINSIIAQFIFKVFEKVFTDFKLFNPDKNFYECYKQSLLHQNIKNFDSKYLDTSSIKTRFQMKLYGATSRDDLIDKVEQSKEKKIAQKEKEKNMLDAAREELKEKQEGPISEQEVIDLKEDMEYQEKINDEIIEEFDITQARPITDMMDIGGDFGTEDQNMETAGSGINEFEYGVEMDQFKGDFPGPPPSGQTSGPVVGADEWTALGG